MRIRDKRSRRKNEPPSPNMVDTERYERLLEVMEELSETNLQTPVVVEGKRDEAALRELGLTCDIITYNTGKSAHDFCEAIANEHSSVVLLMDWDSAGQRLQEKLSHELQGHWEEHESFRRLLRVLCQKEVKDIEGVPGLIRRLEANAIARPEG